MIRHKGFGSLPLPQIRMTQQVVLGPPPALTISEPFLIYVRAETFADMVRPISPERLEAERLHREARGPGTRKRRTKIDRYPFKVAAPVNSYARPRRLTAWCRDNTVGKYRMDNIGCPTRRFHFADPDDAMLFQIFAGGVAV